MEAVKTLEVVGQPVKRVDVLEKVLGVAQYGGDLSFPGMLYAKTLRSPYPHARVLRVDTSQAEAMLGVEAVVTARDVAVNLHGVCFEDQPVLVGEGETARMVGDPIALVAAQSERIALEAVTLIRVDYEELAVVSEAEEALRPGAPRLHAQRDDNLCSHMEIGRGDVEEGFAQAEAVVEETFLTPRQEHAYLEPEGGVATIDAQGFITVYAGSQNPSYTRLAIAKTLGLKENKVRVASPLTGGAFGGKDDALLHIHLALLSLKTGRPVRLVWTREESMLLHPKRHPIRIHLKMGATKEGKLTAIQAHLLSDGGPYASQSPRTLVVSCACIPGPYDIPHIEVKGDVVYTNNPISGSFRGFGAPQAMTATECALDALAQKLGMNRVEIRLKNALRQGMTPPVRGLVLDSRVSLPDTLREALVAVGPLPGPSAPHLRTGRGICCGMPFFDVGANPVGHKRGTGASVELFSDGSAVVRSGACELGQGINTVLAQIVAEEVGIPVGDISVISGDTWAAPKAGPTVASRSAYTSGNAVRLAAQELKERLLAQAAEKLEIGPKDLEIREGRVQVRELPQRGLAVREVVAACYDSGVDLFSQAWFIPTHATLGQAFMTTIADLQVDQETGEIKILQVVCAHDSGKALNPINVRGQLLGGMVQGLGYTLMEDMPSRGGIIQTPSLAEYLIPTSLDIPQATQAVIVEEANPTGPYGARGAGEHAMDTAPAAILNALYDAVGVRILDFPASPDKVLKALGPKAG